MGFIRQEETPPHSRSPVQPRQERGGGTNVFLLSSFFLECLALGGWETRSLMSCRQLPLLENGEKDATLSPSWKGMGAFSLAEDPTGATAFVGQSDGCENQS